ncbi:MAG: right-handed parallel beta-helix repeat-containing protein [Candidatus Eisenbacteria bacterium]
MRRFVVIAWTLALMIPAAGFAKTWHVGEGGSADSEQLKQTVENLAKDGDTVLVHPGVYERALVYVTKKNLVIKSVEGPEKTILDGGQSGILVVWLRLCNESTVFEGFTVRNGYDTQFGGGIRIGSGADPVIRNNILEECRSPWGGGIYLAPKSKATIEGNLFKNCIATASGGGIYAQNNSPTIRNNTFIGNNAEKLGSAVGLFGSAALLEGNLFAYQLGLSVVGVLNDQQLPTLQCNGFWQNKGADVGAAEGIEAPADGSKKTVDPAFEDGPEYRLSEGSPLRNAGECGKIGR